MVAAVKTTRTPHRMTRFNRLVRMLLMVQELRFFHSWQLQGQLRVSLRTIFRDLAALQDAGVVLVYDARHRQYHFTGVDLSR
jgi:predicted DNA-binding transcriptional regulator YafY